MVGFNQKYTCSAQRAKCSHQRQAKPWWVRIFIGEGPKARGLHTLRWWPQASLLCVTQEQCLRIDGGVGKRICVTTRSCRHKALLSRIEGGFQSKKHSRLAQRAKRSRQRQAKPWWVRILMAEGPKTWGQLTLRWWPQASLLCGDGRRLAYSAVPKCNILGYMME